MRSVVLQKIIKTIKKQNMIHPGEKILAGLSGGADSCCLLHILLTLRESLSFTVGAVHVHHGLRGTQADKDEEFVVYLCRRLRVPLTVFHRDVLAKARKDGLTIEAAGREARQEAYGEALRIHRADKIALAHNQNDQAETILLNLIRGSGMKGLAGIPAVRGSIIRPLIEIERWEIENYCSENAIAFRTDESNFSGDYRRNRIRLELIPHLKERYNPSVVKTLSRTGLILREDEELIDELTDAYFEKALTKMDENNIFMDITTIRGYPDAMKRRVIRKALERLGLLTDITFLHSENILELMLGQTGKSLDLPSGLKVKNAYGSLVLSRKNDKLGDGFSYKICLDDMIYIKEANKYITMSMEKVEIPEKYVNIYTKKFSYDRIKNEISLRNRRSGDRIYFKSIGGHKKIKDYFIDKKTPRELRNKIPLLADGGEIMWILDESLASSDIYKPDSGRNIFIQIWEKAACRAQD